MKLHHDKEAFKDLVTITSQQLGIEEIYIEKDYYVVLALKSLSESEFKENGIFKGGTSLSKAYGVINRFSEDIDMAVINDKGEERGNKNKLKGVLKTLASHEDLEEDNDHPRTNKASNWLKRTVLNYPNLKDVEDYGQASKHVFIDISRITPGIPFEERQVSTYIHDYLAQSNQKDVIEEFSLEPISIMVLSIERTFIEKFCAVVKFASQPDNDGNQTIDRLRNGVRHLYDLHMLLQEERIQSFINEGNQVDGLGFEEFVNRVLQDDLEGMKNEEGYNYYMNSKFARCSLYVDIEKTWEVLRPTYEGDFMRLLFKTPEPPTSGEIINSLKVLKGLCERFDAWKENNKVTYRDIHSGNKEI